jgi:hypothetical protein
MTDPSSNCAGAGNPPDAVVRTCVRWYLASVSINRFRRHPGVAGLLKAVDATGPD